MIKSDRSAGGQDSVVANPYVKIMFHAPWTNLTICAQWNLALLSWNMFMLWQKKESIDKITVVSFAHILLLNLDMTKCNNPT